MKKRLLFVMNNLQCGGAEKSLISLLQTLDYSRVEVDLFLFRHEGIFMSQIPEQVNLLNEPRHYKYFNMSIKTALAECLRRGNIRIALARTIAQFIFITEKNKARCEQRAWKYVSKSVQKIQGRYDVAIGYLEKNPIYCVIDKTDAHTKIGWIHTNYSNLEMDAAIDRPFFNKLDRLVTVSEECARAIQEEFQDQQEKVKVIHNIVSPSIIRHMAGTEPQEQLQFDREFTNIITLSRLSYAKGIDFAIEACRILVGSAYKVKWYILGFGTDQEQKDCRHLIEKYGLENHFILLGVKDNPYPYIRHADLYVQTSRFEGKSIAIDEAKIMHKPIVVTNFSTAKDQIEHEKNGLIVEMNPEAIAEGIVKLITGEELRTQWVNQLSQENLGTESEIDKLYELIL
ncbi:glycosyltransferase [Paenibacillus sp. BR2-3]|uniref:glycosyltransferase n=1 Tax=Paenibacillus sp. BR2-3 TaxID=3048494 RepID=UPI003977C88C